MEALLEGELQGVGAAGEVGIAVTPGVEIARSAKSLALGTPAVLADVVDEDDGEVVVSLQQAQVTEEAGHVARGVFIPTVEPDEGIEDEEPRLDLGESGGELVEIRFTVEAESGLGDEVEVEALRSRPRWRQMPSMR